MNGATWPRFLVPSCAAALTALVLTEVRVETGALACDFTAYHAAQGLTAAVARDLLVVSWNGQAGAELRARYAIDEGQPLIRDLSVR